MSRHVLVAALYVDGGPPTDIVVGPPGTYAECVDAYSDAALAAAQANAIDGRTVQLWVGTVTAANQITPIVDDHLAGRP